MDKTKTNRRTFLGFAGSVVGSLLIPDWGQRVFPMYPRTRIILPTEPMIEILRDGCVVDFVKGVKASGISPHELREILECRVGSVGGALGCWPDMIICGNSLEMRDWSRERQAEYVERLTEKVDGTPLVTATEACEAALRTVGARKIAILSPMGAEHSHSAEAYYRSLGFDVAGATWLKAKESKDIINVTLDDIVGAFDTIDSDDIDTILHLGGALGIVSMIEDFEAKFGKPVVSVNAATYWYALRKHGLTDPMPGFGQLLMNEAVAIY